MSSALALLGWLACAPPSVRPEARWVAGGVELSAEAPITRVEVVDASGAPRVTWEPARPELKIFVPFAWSDGERYAIRALGAGWAWQEVREASAPAPPAPDTRVDPAHLSLVRADFPADALGRPERARPVDAVELPPRWWSGFAARFGLGTRPRDEQAPWAWEAVRVANAGPSPATVVIRAGTWEGDALDPAFRPRFRDLDGEVGVTAALLRVPAGGEAVAVLPVHVDGAGVPEGSGLRTRRVELLVPGRPEAVARAERPWQVRRSGSGRSVGFGVAVGTSLIGLLGLLGPGGRALRQARTADLVVIASFAGMNFVVATASRVLGLGVGALLGPFEPLLTGLVDDAFRTVLLVSLLALIPRPGVMALATVVGWLLRGVALGSLHPADLLYLGSVAFWLEGALWLSGLTRDPAWREEPALRQWARLSLGFGGANAAAALSGLVTTMVLYRLYLADWYVALLVGLPGFAYVLVGCALAVPFARAARQVAP